MHPFHAVGVGPGDPDLLTLKAARLVAAADALYHAGPAADRGRAWEVVRGHVRGDAAVRCVLPPGAAMAEVSADWRGHYRAGVEAIAADCRDGRRVVFVAEGDPTLYSTAARVVELLREVAPEVPVEIVPGVTSVTAAAARLGRPLVQQGETLAVGPADAGVPDADAVALLKPRGRLAALDTRGYDFAYAEELGTPREFVTTDPAAAAARDAYFAVALLRRRPEPPTPGVWVVGIGPGDLRLLTPQARAALRAAEVVVGYGPYVESLAPLGLRAELRPLPIGEERERASLAVELAQGGRRVALVSSGDAGVYGMAGLLCETAAGGGVEVEVVPGVTAATAAAALLGAPLGHDWASVSLSDLLTPWDVIERRIDAAGRADFVLAVYNPVSKRRTWQLPRLREVLLRHRPAATVVGLVDRAFRPGQRVWTTTLGELTADGVGMETIFVVGNAATRVIDGRVVTPRGYVCPPSPGFAGEGSGVREGQSRRQERDVPPGFAAEGPHPRPLSRRAGRGEHEPTAGAVGRAILAESFAIIDRELGPRDLPPWARAVARRMVHATADFDFADALRWSADFPAAAAAALRAACVVVTDTEMVRAGLRPALARWPQVTTACHLNDADAPAGLTRSAAGVRAAARIHTSPLLVVGNAPTALDEALAQIEGGWRPRAVVGLPVGFVGVVEAKRRLLAQNRVPYLTCEGRKGGSPAAAAAVNALAEWVAEHGDG